MDILIVTILILLLGVYAYTAIKALAKHHYKKFLLMTLLPIILLAFPIMWFLTTIPYDIGIRKTPTIEFIKMRKATDTEISTHLYNDLIPAYMIECVSDMRLETWRTGYMCLFCSQTLSDFSYREMVNAHDSTLMSHWEVTFIKEENGRFVYHIPFQLKTNLLDSDETKEIPITDIKQSLHCKIFCRKGIPDPVVGTSEMIIPLDSLKKIDGDSMSYE